MTKKTKTETKVDAKTDLAKKKEKLDEIKKMVQKKFGEEAMTLMSDGAKAVPCIPTGSLLLDLALGSGGYPEGRIIEIYGPEASGKTTLTLHAAAQVQQSGGTVAFIDAEHALDPVYAQAVGVDVPNLLISQPDDGEQALDIVEMLVETGEVDLIIVDSVAALTPRAELEGEMGDHNMGLQARMMSKACRKLTGVAKKKNVTIMFINQLRMKIGVMFGNPETTTGGNALKFYASLRLDVRRLKAKSGDSEKEGIMKVKVVKNKVAPPFKVCEIPVVFGKGIDQAGEVYQLAKEVLGIFRLGGGTHYYEGEKSIKLSKETAEKYMIEEINPGDKFASKRDDAMAMLSSDKAFYKAVRAEVDRKLQEKLKQK